MASVTITIDVDDDILAVLRDAVALWPALHSQRGPGRPTQRLPLSPSKRMEVLARDDYHCVYCGRGVEDGDVKLHVDHVIPVSAGGSNDVANLVTACDECNGGKGASTLTNLPVVSSGILDNPTKVERCTQWLIEEMANGEWYASTELFNAGKQLGFSESVVRKAKQNVAECKRVSNAFHNRLGPQYLESTEGGEGDG